VDRFWWASWTSNPVTGRDVRGGFDSHALPPTCVYNIKLKGEKNVWNRNA